MDARRSDKSETMSAKEHCEEQAGRLLLVGREWEDLTETGQLSWWNRHKAMILWGLGILAGSALSTLFGYLLTSL